MMTTCIRYDSKEVEASLVEYLSNPSDKTLHRFYTAIVQYGIVRAKAFLRPHRNWLSESSGDFSSEDLLDYFTDKLFKYVDHSPTFNRTRWLSNPSGCLAVFFTSRAKDFLKRAYRFHAKCVQQDHAQEGWGHLPGRFLDPQDELDTKEQERMIEEALLRLPVDLSRIVRAKRQGKKSAQVAVELGIPVKAVYEGTRKALALLKVELQAYLSA